MISLTILDAPGVFVTGRWALVSLRLCMLRLTPGWFFAPFVTSHFSKFNEDWFSFSAVSVGAGSLFSFETGSNIQGPSLFISQEPFGMLQVKSSCVLCDDCVTFTTLFFELLVFAATSAFCWTLGFAALLTECSSFSSNLSCSWRFTGLETPLSSTRRKLFVGPSVEALALFRNASLPALTLSPFTWASQNVFAVISPTFVAGDASALLVLWTFRLASKLAIRVLSTPGCFAWIELLLVLFPVGIFFVLTADVWLMPDSRIRASSGVLSSTLFSTDLSFSFCGCTTSFAFVFVVPGSSTPFECFFCISSSALLCLSCSSCSSSSSLDSWWNKVSEMDALFVDRVLTGILFPEINKINIRHKQELVISYIYYWNYQRWSILSNLCIDLRVYSDISQATAQLK